MIETLVDPDISVILSELEDGDKESSYLTGKLQLTDVQIRERLSYVIQHGFVKITQNGNNSFYCRQRKT
ncbi:MAG: hypothetical protein WEC35_04805 [Nitrosopumilaceae archaeon]